MTNTPETVRDAGCGLPAGTAFGLGVVRVRTALATLRRRGEAPRSLAAFALPLFVRGQRRRAAFLGPDACLVGFEAALRRRATLALVRFVDFAVLLPDRFLLARGPCLALVLFVFFAFAAMRTFLAVTDTGR